MVLEAARDKNSPNANGDVRKALEDLCQTYWYPLYTFARRKGESPEAAMDATQSFFADLLEKSWINHADPTRGRFRSYLLTVFRRFLNDERKRQQAAKRGGDRVTWSIDAASAEQRYQLEPTDNITADDAFERRWAMALLDTVYTKLRDEFTKKDKLAQFNALQQYLLAADRLPYADVAEELEMSVSNVKVVVHRLRQRYRILLEQEVAQTVESTSDIDSEINSLLLALSRR